MTLASGIGERRDRKLSKAIAQIEDKTVTKLAAAIPQAAFAPQPRHQINRTFAMPSAPRIALARHTARRQFRIFIGRGHRAR